MFSLTKVEGAFEEKGSRAVLPLGKLLDEFGDEVLREAAGVRWTG